MANDKKFGLTKINYILMAVAAVIIMIGFFMMTGVKSGETYNPEIYATRYVTTGPMISFFGFLFMIVAIMFKLPAKKD